MPPVAVALTPVIDALVVVIELAMVSLLCSIAAVAFT